jgi:mannose-6-phosphate isomerase-like protein (cupin superfamily)
METTLLKRREEMNRAPLPECHGGRGALDWITVLADEDVQGRHLNFIHDDMLAPGVSIGVHRHEGDEEYYYIISGHGVMTLDGERFAVKSGDITGVYPGGEHGLENTSEEDMRIVVICVS